MRALLSTIGPEAIVAAEGGTDLWRTADGENWLPVDRRGFGNPYNWGIRNLVSTPRGLFVGTANVFGRSGRVWPSLPPIPPVLLPRCRASTKDGPAVVAAMPSGRLSGLCLFQTVLDRIAMAPDSSPHISDATDTTYEPYSQDPGYIAANTALIETIDLAGVTRVADLACGTGLLSGLLFGRKGDLRIAGIDLDPVQIGIARRSFPGPVVDGLAALRVTPGGAATFDTGSAMDLPFDDGEIDLVLIGNAIHLMPDRDAFLRGVARVLRPGGQLVFNSVFYVGTFVPGTEPLYTEWMRQAVFALDALNAERAARGEGPVPRIRGKGSRAFRKDWLSAEGWGEAMRAAGIDPFFTADRPVPISREGLALVGAYGGLAEVLMSGYPVEVASQCLMTAAPAAFDALGLEAVPRNWLEMRGTRR